MKRSLMSIIVAVCCLGIASTALADGRGDRGDRHHHSDRYDNHRHKHHGKHDRHDDRRWHRGPPPRVYYSPPPRVYYAPHRARWERGARLPSRYRHDRYVVHDWHDRRFDRPPRGYHWVNVGADYLLVGIATGVILQAILRD